MNSTILVTRPNYDDATNYLYYYTKQVIDFALNRNIKVLDLIRPRLTKENFSNLILKNDPSLVFFNAQGDETKIYGDKINNKEEILIEENKNQSILSKRIIYARACWAAASLGKRCIKDGGCFIGYKYPFSFWTDDRWSSKPLNDNTAKLFFEPSNLIVTSLLKGNTTQEAFDKSLDISKKIILGLLKRKEEPGTMASITLLWNNVSAQEILGQKDIKFTF